MSSTPEPEPDDGARPVPDDTGASGPRRRRRRRRWWIPVLAVGLLLLAWGVAAGLKAFSAYGHAKDGLAVMNDVRGTATQDLPTFISSIGDSGTGLPQQVPDELALAARSFAAARDDMDSPLLAPFKVLPVVGRQIRSVSSLSDAAAQTAADAGHAFKDLSDEAAKHARTPEERLAAIGRTQVILTDLRDRLRKVDLGPDEGLVGPLARSRATFVRDYDRTLDTLDRAATGVTGVNTFLTGPTTYLVLAANNAEMRAGSGMYLQVGTLTVQNGRFTLGEFISVEDLLLARPGARVDPDIQGLWGWLVPNQEWRNLNLSPRFDESARMAAEMWAASGRGQVDGVIAIDVLGLQRLLKVTGPVQVPDGTGGTTTVSADNVKKDLLLEQYLTYRNETDRRRERLGKVGTAVFGAFNERPVAASELLRAFQEAGAGRNLLLWSSDPAEQNAWKALGAAGAVPADSLMVSIINRGGNKLDQFQKVKADLTSVTTGANRRVSVQVSIENSSPTSKDYPTYVVGPYPRTNAQRGEYVGIVSLTVPKGAGNPSSQGADLFLTGDDGPTRVLTTKVDLASGASTQVTFQFDLPTSWTQVEVLPSARTPRVTWTAGNMTWTDNAPRTVPLEPLG